MAAFPRLREIGPRAAGSLMSPAIEGEISTARNKSSRIASSRCLERNTSHQGWLTMMRKRSPLLHSALRDSAFCLVSLATALSLGACSSDDPTEGDPGGSGGAGANSAGGSASSSGGSDSAAGGAPGSGSSQGSGGENTNTGGDDGGTQPTARCPAFEVERLDAPALSSLGSLYDTSSDNSGPSSHSSQYGKSPELIPWSDGDSLDVFAQDQSTDERAHVLHVEKVGDDYSLTHAYRVDSLGRIMGLTRDTAGNYYVATGVREGESVDADYPPNKIHRSDVVCVVKFDPDGNVLMRSDVDIERRKAKEDSEIIVNPMVAASSRLVWGGDRLLLVHGHNTEPDANINGTRHQKALSTHINANDGSVTRTSTMWVSHSFDQRALYDGTGFVELHLGDAYPRRLVLAHFNDAGGRGGYNVYDIKGATGANNTYTRLGGIVELDDEQFGYMALFATERTADVGSEKVNGTRDLGLVRVKKDFVSSANDEVIIEEGGTTSSQVVTSKDNVVTNSLHWLTNLGPGLHAERPRITATDGGSFVVLFERWTDEGAFEGTFAMTIDSDALVLESSKKVSDEHLSRGDDIVTLDGSALFVTSDGTSLHLQFVNSLLDANRVELN